jgi:hypothetical protein
MIRYSVIRYSIDRISVRFAKIRYSVIRWSLKYSVIRWFEDSMCTHGITESPNIFEYLVCPVTLIRKLELSLSWVLVSLSVSRDTADIRWYSMIRCANSNIESPNHERIGKYSLYRIIESPNIESWRIFLIFDSSNIESPNQFGDRILNHDLMIRYSVIEYRILRITEYLMIRYP